MPPAIPPVKTSLGIEEMRSRTHVLNQRHRTMLFLVDGRRPLSEVLAMAMQAGARTSHFEDLVRLGLVQLDTGASTAEPTPAIARTATASEYVALDRAAPTTRAAPLAVEGDALAEPTRMPAPGMLTPPQPPTQPLPTALSSPLSLSPSLSQALSQSPSPSLSPSQATLALPASASPPPDPAIPPTAAKRARAMAVRGSGLAGSAAAAAQPHPPDAVPGAAHIAPDRVASASVDIDINAPVPPAAPGEIRQPAATTTTTTAPKRAAPLVLRNVPAEVSSHTSAALAADAAAEAVRQQVRDCLLDTLRIDAPLYAAITLVRVRRATQTKDLIELVWEIERYLGTTRKNHRELQSLHRARELLGMGNTQFDLDTQPGFADSR